MDHAANFRSVKAFGFFLALFGSAFSNSFCGIGLGTYIGAFACERLLDKTLPWRPFPAWRLLLILLLSFGVSVVLSDDR